MRRSRPTPTRHGLGGAAVCCALTALTAVALTPETAQASGYLTARFGGDHGTPSSANVYAIYFNPAALGPVKGSEATVDISVAFRSVTYDRTPNALTPSTSSKSDPVYVAANTGKGTLNNVVPLPFAGITTDLGMKKVRFGYAVYVPFGGLATWDKADRVGENGRSWTNDARAPGAVDGAQRWQNISGKILAIYNTLAVAYQISPTFYVGFNVSGVYHEVETVRARNVDGSDDTRASGGALIEGRSIIKGHGFNLAASIGLYFEPIAEKLKIGLSYSSQPGFGETRLSSTLRQQFGKDPALAETSETDFLQTYPDIFRLGVNYHATKKLEIRADAEFVRWSVFKRQCLVLKGGSCDVDEKTGGPLNGDVVLNIPRSWQNSIGARLGFGYHLNDDVEFFMSGAITTSAVPKSKIDVSTIDSFRVYGSIGAKFRVDPSVALAVSYNHIYFAPVNTDGTSDYAKFVGASKSPSADGEYKSVIGFVNVNATYSF